MKLKLLALPLSLAAFTGCEDLFKEDTTSPDGSAPYITVQSPHDNAVYAAGEAVKIKSEISDKDKIQQLEVLVTSMETGTGEVLRFIRHPKKTPVILDTTFSAAGLKAGGYTISLHTIDGRTNVGTKVIRFSIK
jgi:hypothetical protein